jgi:hypothetical protein
LKPPAVIINANAGSVRRDPQLVERIRAQLPAENLRLTLSVAEVEPALRDLLGLGSDTLVVVGGDGTAGTTLTALVRVAGGDPLPRVVMAGGGSVNTIPRSLGARGRPDAVVARWLAAAEPRGEQPRPLLAVSGDGADPRYGLIFGNGVVYRWLERYYDTKTGPVAAARTVARSIGSVLVRGPLARQLFARFAASLEIDDGTRRDGHFTGFAASTVRDIGLGFRPFASAGRDLEHFHWIDTDASGLRLGLELPAQLLGRGTSRGSCLRHESPRRVAFETADPMSYMLDADLFPPALRVSVETGPLVSFAHA